MTHLDGVLKLNNNILIKRGCLKSVVPCHIEPVEVFQLTDNQYRFRQAQPDKQNTLCFLDSLFLFI